MKDLEELYELPAESGLKYRFSKIDAVWMWTNGGYQIARNQDDYPIFIDVLETELEDWKQFFEESSVDYRVKERGGNGAYYVLFPLDSFSVGEVDGHPVWPMEKTLEWMKKYRANFEPAIEMMPTT